MSHSNAREPKRPPSTRYGQLPRLVDICEVAEHLGVSVRHVRRLVAERRIPYVKWGNLLRFDPEEISTWLVLRRVDPLLHAAAINEPSDRCHITDAAVGGGVNGWPVSIFGNPRRGANYFAERRAGY